MPSSETSPEYLCKICQGPVKAKHAVAGITYFYCNQCDFLQNYYWESEHPEKNEQTAANDVRRLQCWPAGKDEDMHEKGWEILELMYWPIAWLSRQVNEFLRVIPVYRVLVKAVVKFKAGRLLDFGCGHGVIVLQLRDKEKINVIGLDPYSPVENEFILRQDLLAAHFEPNMFGGIFSIETVEHLGNPVEIFEELYRILKPGGILLVQTSRLEDPEYALNGDKWFYLNDPKTHVGIYSKKAMIALAQKTGFRSVRFRGVKFARFVK